VRYDRRDGGPGLFSSSTLGPSDVAAPFLCAGDDVNDQVQQSWDRGFDDGKAGRPAASLSRLTRTDIDELSYLSGYLEGAARARKARHSPDAGPYSNDQIRALTSGIAWWRRLTGQVLTGKTH
jgi:hypothetical protein